MSLDDQAEAKLLPVADQPLKDIIVLIGDTGMRSARELYRMRVENIDWNSRVIFQSKQQNQEGPQVHSYERSRNEHLAGSLRRSDGSVGFSARQKGKHINGGLVNKQWVRARKKACLLE